MTNESETEQNFQDREARCRVPDTQMDNCLAIMSSQTLDEAIFFLKRAWRNALAESGQAYASPQAAPFKARSAGTTPNCRDGQLPTMADGDMI